MASISLTDPNNGDVVDAVLHQNNYGTLEAAINGGLDASNLAPGAAILDTQLAAANNSAYKSIFEISGSSTGSMSNGTYLYLGSTVVKTGTGTTSGVPSIYIASADYTVDTKLTRLRLRATMQSDNTAAAATFTVGLYPLSAVAGGSGLLSYTVGTVVTGSTVAFTTPAANSILNAATSDFALPADGTYVIAYAITSGPTAANHAGAFGAQLQLHHI